MGCLQVRRWNLNFCPQPRPLNNRSFKLKRTIQETPGQPDLAGKQRLPDRGARHTIPPELHLMHFADPETLFFPDFLQQIEASLSPVSKSKIGSHINLLWPELFPQRPDGEVARLDLGQLHVERNNHNQRNSERFDRGQLLSKRLYLQRRVVRRQDLERMRMKRHHGGSAANLGRSRYDVAHQILVAKMHSVEVPDRDDRRRIFRGQLIQAIDYFHGTH